MKLVQSSQSIYHTFAGGTNDILTFFRVVLLLFEALCCQAETDYRLLWDSRDPAAQTSHLLPLFGPQNLLKYKYYINKVLSDVKLQVLNQNAKNTLNIFYKKVDSGLSLEFLKRFLN